MICGICGSHEVYWRGPLLKPGEAFSELHSECTQCGAIGCHLQEPRVDDHYYDEFHDGEALEKTEDDEGEAQ